MSLSLPDAALRRLKGLFPGPGLWLVLPAVLLAVALLLVPLMGIIGRSLQSGEGWSLANYTRLFEADGRVFRLLLLRSLGVAATTTLVILLLAYPTAYFMAMNVRRGKTVWLMLIIIPFWSSYLLRVFALKIILGYNGIINSGLMQAGLISAPLEWMLYSKTAVIITLVHSWAPFAVLPIYVSLEKLDRTLLEAAADLGDNAWKRFFRVTLPLSLPGVGAAALMVFIPIVGDFVTPSLVGGRSGLMVGNYISEIFTQGGNTQLGSAMSVATMTVIAICVGLALAGVYRFVPAAGKKAERRQEAKE